MAPSPALLSPVRSLCPECLAEAPGAYIADAGQVRLRRRCAVHGVVDSPFWGDVAHFEWTRRMDAAAGQGACCAPGTPGCGPSTDGKRCVAVLPITDGCNLACPYCFASSGPGQAHRSLDEVEGMLAGALEDGGGPMPLQLSGGEPTVHPDILDIARLARRRGFGHVEVNTNGVLLGTRRGFAEDLREAGVGAVYLQFDGLGASSHLVTRGVDLGEAKRRAIAACRDAGLRVVLAPTVVPGRNDGEVGAILRFALENRDVVRGVNFQPVRHIGRFAEDGGHLSPDRLARLLAQQTEFLRMEDLRPFPCCSAACYLAASLLATDHGPVPLTRSLPDSTYIEVVAGIEDRRYMDLLAGSPTAPELAEEAARRADLPLPASASDLLPDILSVAITSFMDAHTVDVDRLARCCVRVVTRAGRLAPFCGYYLTDARGRYAWRARAYPEDAELPAAFVPGGLA